MTIELTALLLFASIATAMPNGVNAGTPAAAEATTIDPRQVVGPPKGAPIHGAALAARTEEVAALLRCPVCQGLSVNDSPATMAVNMKAQVKELLAAGFDRDQVLVYFESSYGEFVRLEPPLRGVNWLVWLAPGAALLAGAAAIAWTLRRRSATGQVAVGTESPETPGRDTLPDDAELRPYVLRVREHAYGWAGGRPPGEPGAR